MKVLKRNGAEVDFDINKIVAAIGKANAEVPEEARISKHLISAIAEDIATECENMHQTPTVEDIQDLVEVYLMKYGAGAVSRCYITYRYKHMLARKANTTDDAILSLIDLKNEEAKAENANKNPTINSTQRDYMAGEVSKDLTRRVILPADIVRAHDEAIIHFHDTDYFAQHIHNCDLINLEDMLQNGTVISETLIESPKSFHTACNITTQIVAQVSSNQYGGQTFNLAHLVPFVQVSRNKFKKKVQNELRGLNVSDERMNEIVEERLLDEIKSGVQLIQYQLVTLLTTNGQAPFVSVYMNINDVPKEQQKDYAIVIEEVLKQRIQGTKNEQGVWVTPAFPKLLYVLDENNVYENSEFFYLTELAAKCTAKRMVPDYISAKIMRKLKNGDVYACMGKWKCSPCKTFRTALAGVRKIAC